MHRIFLGLTALVLAGGTAAAQTSEKVVHVYNRPDYVDGSILDDFTAETGIEVVYDVYDSDRALEAKLRAGHAGYDVVVTSGAVLEHGIQAGAFMKLDTSKLPNLVHMWDKIRARTDKLDPGHQYSVNYMWGTTGIGYNVDAVRQRLGTGQIDSWSVIFDPGTVAKFADCHVYIPDAPTQVIPAALTYLGHDPNSHDAVKIREAGALMAKIRPYVTQARSSTYVDALASGEACLAVGGSGDVLKARDRAEEEGNGVHVGYAVPKEGALTWFDQMAIPADAPHPENALRFINYMQNPKVIATASNFVYLANGNKDSQQYLNADLINDPAIYPPPEAIDRLYVVTPYPPEVQRVLTRTWARVKTGG